MNELLIITLVLVACIGLGVLLGWVLWGNDMKYYKNLYERKLTLDSLHSPEMKEKIIEIGKKYDPKKFKTDKISKGITGKYGIIEHYHETKE